MKKLFFSMAVLAATAGSALLSGCASTASTDQAAKPAAQQGERVYTTGSRLPVRTPPKEG